MNEITVETAKGRVTGTGVGELSRFYGIPYAPSPRGAARFDAPGRAPTWVGKRDATRPGPAAPAPPRDRVGALDMTPISGGPWTAGDDYLTVNVWTQRASGPARPVMVFVHGGGFVAGTGTASLYDGSTFARDGVVFVSLNYRVGVHGWLHLPHAPANRGMRDVLSALTWVRENIAAFGGDPDNVTLFGQSAGATIVAGALAGDQAGQLFHKAISQSGNAMGAFTPEQAERVTRRLADALGVAPTAAAMAPLTDRALVDATSALSGLDLAVDGHPDPLLGLSPFAPVIDGDLLPRQPAETLRTRIGGPVDLMVGTNADEANLYLVPTALLTGTTPDDLYATARLAHPDPDALLDVYRRSRPEATDGQLRAAVMSAGLFEVGSRELLRGHAPSGGARTFGYRFDWPSPAFGGSLGASHCMELPYVFDRASEPSLRGPQALLGPDVVRHDIAGHMHGAWVRFAESGNPGWTPYTPAAPATMHIGDTNDVREDPASAETRIWESV